MTKIIDRTYTTLKSVCGKKIADTYKQQALKGPVPRPPAIRVEEYPERQSKVITLTLKLEL